MKFRKKPVVIEAIQWTGDNIPELAKFTDATEYHSPIDFIVEKNLMIIDTLEGRMEAQIGDWIIKGIKNEFYPCKPDIFEATYEKAED